MSGWRKATGAVAVLPMDNIDTDQLIPARFMLAPRDAGYGRFLLHDLREAGTVELPEGAAVLIAGRNFGSGSSREAAVYALVDAGFRAVIAESFGDIFAANAVNNGLAPVQLTASEIIELVGATGELSVDLVEKSVTRGQVSHRFALSLGHAEKVINGWDDIDLTAAHRDEIHDFRRSHAISHPWAFPRVGAG